MADMADNGACQWPLGAVSNQVVPTNSMMIQTCWTKESMRICLLVIGADRCPVYPARFAWRRLPYLSFMLTGLNASANHIH